MLKKTNLSKDNAIWCGLNRPTMDIIDADLVVFGIPYNVDITNRYGSRRAPEILREYSKISSPFNEHFQCFDSLNIVDAGDFIPAGGLKEYFDGIEKFVNNLVSKNKFFVMVGGDHSTTIPVLKGIDDALDEEFGIVYIDAHFDLHDTVRGDKFSNTSVARRALELKNISGVENITFIGARTIDREEYDFKKTHELNVLNSVLCHRIESDRIGSIAAKQLKKYDKIYITLDIDCLDPAYAAGTASPQFAGLYGRQLLNILDELFKNLNIIGMDIVEIAPDLDPSLASTYAGRKIFQEVCGHCAKKVNKLED